MYYIFEHLKRQLKGRRRGVIGAAPALFELADVDFVTKSHRLSISLSFTNFKNFLSSLNTQFSRVLYTCCLYAEFEL